MSLTTIECLPEEMVCKVFKRITFRFLLEFLHVVEMKSNRLVSSCTEKISFLLRFEEIIVQSSRIIKIF